MVQREEQSEWFDVTYWELNCDLHQKYMSPDLPVHGCDLL